MRHLQDLNLQHDLGFGKVLCGNQLFREPDHVRRTSKRHGIGVFVDHDLLDLQQALQKYLHLFCVDVGQLEGSDLQLLILQLLAWRGRVDEERVRIQDLLVELVLQQDQIDRILDRGVGDKNRRLEVRAHIAVKNDIQPRGAREPFKDHPHIGIAKLQCHRCTHDRCSCALFLPRGPLLPPLVFDQPHHLLRLSISRVLRKHVANAFGRAVIRAALQHPFGLGQDDKVAQVRLERCA